MQVKHSRLILCCLIQAEKVPQSDWERMGLWVPRPNYSEHKYYSLTCTPTKGENRLFYTLMKRTRVSIREAVHMIVNPKDAKLLRTDKGLDSYIRVSVHL